MIEKDRKEILRILNEIKSRSKLVVKGGSGGAQRYSMREPLLIWELGNALIDAIKNSSVSDEKQKAWIRKVSRKYDTEILGEGNEWCITAFEWIQHFKEKDHYLFVCKLAGYRDNKEKNRFNKRRVRYIRPIFTKIDESSLTKDKISKLTKILESDDTLELNDPDYLDIITKIRGKGKFDWSFIMTSIEDLSGLVETAMDKEEGESERKKLRENLGETLIKQLRYALQLCVMENQNDFDGATEKVKDVFKKKTKTNYVSFQKLFDNLKVLLKSFEEKKKRIKKKDFYELEQLNSNLDAISDENIYKEFMKRKNSIGEVFG